MRKIITIILLLLPFFIFSQIEESKESLDTISVVFKAKLFTISKHGLKSKDELVKSIDNIGYKVYNNNEFVFIKLRSRYYCLNKNDMFTANWCDCDYYVCYSVKKDVYYLLGGFEIDNIEEFAKEYKGSLFSANWTYKIDDKNLSEFIEQMNLGKIKKAKNCFVKCTETWD